MGPGVLRDSSASLHGLLLAGAMVVTPLLSINAQAVQFYP